MQHLVKDRYWNVRSAVKTYAGSALAMSIAYCEHDAVCFPEASARKREKVSQIGIILKLLSRFRFTLLYSQSLLLNCCILSY